MERDLAAIGILVATWTPLLILIGRNVRSELDRHRRITSSR